MIEEISFNLVTEADHPFLFSLYVSTRTDELSLFPWDETQKLAFLQQQFAAQSGDWNRTVPHARRQIIFVDGIRAGRLYVDFRTSQKELRLVDISLLPQFRNRGLGKRILEGLVDEADERGWRISLHVALNNPAQRLYARLGFVPATSADIYIRMDRPPQKCEYGRAAEAPAAASIMQDGR